MINHYDILEVNKQATSKEIQFAYERMKTLTNGRMWHPDWNSNSHTYKTMRQIHEAHKVLSDKTLREQYDAELMAAELLAAEQLAAEQLVAEQLANEKMKLWQEQHRAALADFNTPTPIEKPTSHPSTQAPPLQKPIAKKEHWLRRWFNKLIGKQ